MSEGPRVGLIPLYLALYDEVRPQYRPQVESFARHVAQRLAQSGLAVELGGVCCVRTEVERTIADLTTRDVECLATLHLAYSPSLESADALAASGLPLILLDTTPALRFAEGASMDDMFRNHGIHGVQDLASVLRRRGCAYALVAGHADSEGFMEDAVRAARAACAAHQLRRMHVLVFGAEFQGMGDFAIAPEAMARTLGATMQRIPAGELAVRVGRVSEGDLIAEAAADAERFDCVGVSSHLLGVSNRVGLALRAMLTESGANAFSFNFQSFSREAGVPTVPFLEASKAMARGVGYAGEGDALTAALVGALLRGFGEVTFTEMFCPDWAGNAIFMSHMGECNPALAAAQPRLVEKDYVFGDAEKPVVATFPVRPGPATLVNIAPGPGDTFGIIAGRVRVLERFAPRQFPDVPHFWVQPEGGEIGDFLRRYSELGGTHHLALVLGHHVAEVELMARLAGLAFDRV